VPVGAAETGQSTGLANIETAPTSAPAVDFEPMDPWAGAYGGLAFAGVLILLATGLIALAFFQGYTPGWVAWLTASTTNVLIFGVICAGVAALFFGFGKALGGRGA
jgi:hypothetical protein